MSGENNVVQSVHTLVVMRVTPPRGRFDDGSLGYRLLHPSGCNRAQCIISDCIASTTLAFALSYSGTPITVPGSYRIEGWWIRSWDDWYGGWEYDSGVRVVHDAEEASA